MRLKNPVITKLQFMHILPSYCVYYTKSQTNILLFGPPGLSDKHYLVPYKSFCNKLKNIPVVVLRFFFFNFLSSFII